MEINKQEVFEFLAGRGSEETNRRLRGELADPNSHIHEYVEEHSKRSALALSAEVTDRLLRPILEQYPPSGGEHLGRPQALADASELDRADAAAGSSRAGARRSRRAASADESGGRPGDIATTAGAPVPGESTARFSIHEAEMEEADRFKWIESEKAGRDLGESAIRTWIRQHWHGFLRARWLEHLAGRTYWIELDQGYFGLLQRAFPGSSLIDPILEHFKHGRENLDIISWAIEHRLPMNEVREMLEFLDVYSQRIHFSLGSPRAKRRITLRFAGAWN